MVCFTLHLLDFICGIWIINVCEVFALYLDVCGSSFFNIIWKASQVEADKECRAEIFFDWLNFVWSLYYLHNSNLVISWFWWPLFGVSKPLTGSCIYTSITKSHWFLVYSYFLVWIFINLSCQQHVYFILSPCRMFVKTNNHIM